MLYEVITRRQRAGATDLDALETARALPRVDSHGIQPTTASAGFLGRIEEWPRTSDRVRRQQVDELASYNFV